MKILLVGLGLLALTALIGLAVLGVYFVGFICSFLYGTRK